MPFYQGPTEVDFERTLKHSCFGTAAHRRGVLGCEWLRVAVCLPACLPTCLLSRSGSPVFHGALPSARAFVPRLAPALPPRAAMTDFYNHHASTSSRSSAAATSATLCASKGPIFVVHPFLLFQPLRAP